MAVLPAPGNAVAANIATDNAAPIWNSGPYNATTNALDCSGIRTFGTCSLRITTTTSGAACATETITPPGVAQVNTVCSASILGTVTANTTPAGCVLTAISSLTVTFNSGVSSVFNGKFYVSGTFKPLSNYPITAYALTINDASPLQSPGNGYGHLVSSFQISTNGIPRVCNDPDYPNRKGTPKPTQNGHPALTIVVG
jgi:hypothetical protein